MKKIGNYQGHDIIWIDYQELLGNELPKEDWIVFFTSSKVKPNSDDFDQFVKSTIKRGIIEFKAHGKFGEFLHDLFDEIIIDMELIGNYSKVEIMTTFHNNETLADVFWQCFFSTCLPEKVDYQNLKILCSDLDGVDRSQELIAYIAQFERGWLPKD